MLLEMLYKRRSIRRYHPRPVEEEKRDRLIQALLLAPSSKNKRPWEFIVVENRETIIKLMGCKPKGQAPLREAPLLFAVLGIPAKSDVWIEDTSIASILLQLEAEELQLGSCWIQIRNRLQESGAPSEKLIREILAIPEEYSVEALVTVGYPAETPDPRSPADLPSGKVHYELFG